ncbi:MAG: UvrD-helicase domain-containing protein [Sulfuritalea sp.]|jgi:ATP-dependent exoDNAse (exonuclease V) beta subunit|nr:UvrD-helicase domain-containing protein [Sulfuritalea sp.]
MSDLLREDEINRRRALELDSFIVEAPAGAGKTELLTQRYLRLLAIVDEPEEIIAITFTNKAAGEMRQRIADSLALARQAEMPEAAHKRITCELARAALARSAELGWQIETQPGRLRLTTIDALCASLARQMPLLSRFGAQPAVAEEAKRHYDEAARRALDHLEGKGEDEREHAEAVATALAHLDNDVTRLARLLAEMLARREQWRALWEMSADLDHPESAIGEALQEMVGEELALVAEVLDAAWQRQWMPLARFAADNLGEANLANSLSGWTEALAATPEELPRWRALAELLLTQKDEPRKTVTVKNGFPAGKEFKPQKDAMLERLAALDGGAVAALQRLRELPAPDHDHDAVVRALARLMKLAAAELWLVFREAGEVDFGELAARAIAALGDELDPSELGLRLDYRIRHLLVDEFQDTSPAQIELLERLTAGWQPDDGRTLFAVGDPMQSIYRFRKADVGLFLRVAENGIGALRLTPLRLSRNNRSCPAVVDWINASFPAVFPAMDDPLRGEIRYREFAATRDALPQAGVMIHPVLAAKGDSAAGARGEAQQIIALIEAEWREDPTRSIAVLVRARDHLAALVAAIRRHGAAWRFSAVEIEPLAGRQAVQDLISLTRALHHRADRVHWLAVLRAPWCGLTLADLHALAGDDHDATIWSLMNDAARIERLSADGRRRVSHVREVLAEALAGQGRQRRRRWIEDAWKKLGGPACLAGASEAADAQAYFNRLDALDAAGRFVLDSLEDDMGRLYAAPDAQADGRLQLMTIHKAKGLEFDTVILPGLHREGAGRDTPLLAWDSFPLASGERLIAAPVNPRRGRTAGEPTVYDFLQRMEKERSRNEEARVLYVAATRAVRRLHLVAVAQCEEGGALVEPRAASPLARLWLAVQADFERAVASAGAAMEPSASDGLVDELASFVPQLLRLTQPAVPPDWRAPALPASVSDPREDTADALAAAVGTLTHAVLELIAADPEGWPAPRVTERQPGFERWLASRGWPPAEARAGAARVARILVATLGSADGQWVLRRRQDAAAELALTRVGGNDDGALCVPGTPLRGQVTQVVDRCFVEDGVRWIIDYKTVDLGPTADLRLLAVHAGRYRSQLESYAALFAAEGLPQRLAVLYVAHGILASLEYNPDSD